MDTYCELDKSILKEYEQLDTTAISDAMDRHGITCGLLGLKNVVSGTKMVGQAFTVHYTVCGQVHGTVGDFLDDVKPGQVVVIDNGGRLNCTVWGDIMSYLASRNQVAGTVIDGVCRDVPAIKELDYPIFTKGVYMVTGKDRVYVDRLNTPVSICNVQIRPGDLIVGDDSGVVAIPYEMAESILAEAMEIAEKEESIRAALRNGISLKEARAAAGYHRLQSRQ